MARYSPVSDRLRRRRGGWIGASVAGLACVGGLMVVTNPATAGAGGVDCPPEKTNQVALVGLSSSGRNPRLIDERRSEVRHLLAVAGDCGNELIVRAWSTAGAVRTLWSPDDTLVIPGQTEAGRDRRLNGAVDDAMKTLDDRLQSALDELPAVGSDFLAWPDLAADAAHELGADRPLAVTVLDDGVQTGDPNLNQPLTVADASRLAADHAPAADLRGLSVTIEGVGQVAGIPAPAGGEWVPAVRAFAQRTCDATGATCTVLSATTRAG